MIPPITDYIAAHAILQLALWSMLPIVVGSLLRRSLPFLSGALRLVGQIGLFEGQRLEPADGEDRVVQVTELALQRFRRLGDLARRTALH